MAREYAAEPSSSNLSGREYAPDTPRLTSGRRETPDVSSTEKLNRTLLSNNSKSSVRKITSPSSVNLIALLIKFIKI